MGRVWRAVDDILDRQVAVKEMRIDGHDAEDSRTRRERTLREARATARIDHPNVVRVYDVVDEGERLWIVMELVTGRSLERILAEDGALGPRDAARIGLGLVAALRQVHARGVLHRDIKPGNVLVEALPAERADGRDREHRVVLTDFGIAAIQDAEALTMVGMLVGSPDYMAPERVSGRPQGPPSDVWSLGATLCAALGGRSPFARGTTLATLHAVLYEEPEIPAGAGPLRDVLAALLRKEPGTRPGLDELEAALRASTAPPPLPPPTPTPTVPVPAPGPAPAQDPVPPLDPPGGPPGSSAPQGAGGLRDPAPEPTGGAAPAAVPTARSAPAASPAGSDAAAGPAPPPPLPGPAPVGALPEPAPGPATATSRGGPATSGGDPATARPPGVSLDRARAVTEQRPHPAVGPPPGPVGEPESGPGEAGPETGPRAPRRRRAAVVAAAVGVAVTGTVVAVVLTAASGSPGGERERAGPSATAPSVTGDASPTVGGTSRPATLPPGARREAGGFAWTPPEGWRRDVQTGAEVHYTSPDGGQELVAKSALARGNLLTTWQTSERNAHQGQDYEKIRLEETTFRGHPAVVWEYRFTLKGVPWHARLLGFNVGGTSFQINTWYRPADETGALEVYERVKKTFTVL